VSHCDSFITVREEAAYLVHQSAKDYLSDTKSLFCLGRENEHANTARLCIEVMSNTLKKNICSVKPSGIDPSDVDASRIIAHIPFHAQYACLYWVDHLQQASPTTQETLLLNAGCQVYEFFQRHFLHWLEALGFMSRVSEAVLVIKSLRSIPRVNATQRFFINSIR